MTLSEFILSCIAEDEAAARAAFRDAERFGVNPPRADDGVWTHGDHEIDQRRIEGTGMTIYDEGGHTAEQAEHIARHDPARVLATCAALRAVVELHTEPPMVFHEFTSPVDGSHHPRRVVESDTCPVCAEAIGYDGERDDYPCDTLRAVGAIYADREGYDPAWAPIDYEAQAREAQARSKAADDEWHAEHPLERGPDGTMRRRP